MLASGARVRASGDLKSASLPSRFHCGQRPSLKCRCLSDPQDHSLLQQLRGSGGLKIPQQMVHVIVLGCRSCAIPPPLPNIHPFIRHTSIHLSTSSFPQSPLHTHHTQTCSDRVCMCFVYRCPAGDSAGHHQQQCRTQQRYQQQHPRQQQRQQHGFATVSSTTGAKWQ